jgi:hypothetical protein
MKQCKTTKNNDIDGGGVNDAGDDTFMKKTMKN